MREDFENWVRANVAFGGYSSNFKRVGANPSEDTPYTSALVQLAWEAWQASHTMYCCE